jgi:methionyl aminopeptidase
VFTRVKTAKEIAFLGEGGAMLATVLGELKKRGAAGMTPKDMSAIAKKELKALGGEPAFLGFEGYPDIICISVNNQVQHSIPTNVPFQAGDVVNYDFGVRYGGMVTDAGVTVCIDHGETEETARLIKGTEQALYDGLRVVKNGCRTGDISAAIEKTLKQYNLGIVRELVGHGVGHELHEAPDIPNYGSAGVGPRLYSGMTVAIEPITTLGDAAIRELSDGWTFVTRDGSWSAQFEHTILVTDDGCEILTKI